MTTGRDSFVGAALHGIPTPLPGPALHRDLRIDLHFHPDRVSRGRTVLQHLAADRIYRSQFETGTSNGGHTAHPGGDRWRWEHRIFAGAYDEAPADQRPKYGALNHRRRGVGSRTTSRPRCTAWSSWQRMSRRWSWTRDTETPRSRLRRTSWGVRVDWHEGFVLEAEALREHPDFWGGHIVAVAEPASVTGRLDARIIGAAARRDEHGPQDLKKVWHYVARYGRSGSTGSELSSPDGSGARQRTRPTSTNRPAAVPRDHLSSPLRHVRPWGV